MSHVVFTPAPPLGERVTSAGVSRAAYQG